MKQMSLKRVAMCSGASIPQPNSAVSTPTGNGVSIRRECDRVDTICMPLNGLQEFAGVGIPQLDYTVLTGTSECAPIGREG